jgi:multiple sugar transport system permease protein
MTELTSKMKIGIFQYFSFLVLIIVAFFMLIPIIWTFLSSLKPAGEFFTYPPSLFGSHISWINYKIVFEQMPFLRYLFNTIVMCGGVAIIQVGVASLSAFAFARIPFPGRNLIFLIYLSTLMIPIQVTLVPLFLMMTRFGWINTFQGLILPSCFSVFGTFLLRQFFLSIPYELEEAARIDGCNRIQIFNRIILPLAKPAISTLFLFTFVSQWDQFIWPLIITRTEFTRTMSVGIQLFHGQNGTAWNLIMATGILVVIPSTIIFLLCQKYIVKGITMTGGFGGR